jgi:hypothetical protein
MAQLACKEFKELQELLVQQVSMVQLAYKVFKEYKVIQVQLVRKVFKATLD